MPFPFKIITLTQGRWECDHCTTEVYAVLQVSEMRRRLQLRCLRWRIIARSHPLRMGSLLSIAVFVATSFAFRRYLWISFPLWFFRISHPVYTEMLIHPRLGRAVHALYNAVPDAAFALLAVAGLGYLMPETVRNLESRRGIRIFLMVFCLAFAILAIIVNAINREEQDHTNVANGTRLQAVMSSVLSIQEKLNTTKVLSEAERRERLTSSLRDEYILSHDPIDPEILSGAKMPPPEWMNKRLEQMGEHFSVSTALPPPVSTKQIIQQITPEVPKARIEATFYSTKVEELPLLDLDAVAEDLVVVAPVTFRGTGEVAAKNGTVWFRVCTDCAWASDPEGSSKPDPNTPDDRSFNFATIYPNVLSNRIDLHVRIPILTHPKNIPVTFYYSCENCPPVDFGKPQRLMIHLKPKQP